MPETVPPGLVECSWQDQQIKIGRRLETVRDQILTGHIVVLKHALPGEALRSLRQAVHRWGQQTPERTGDIRENADQRSSPGSWHGMEDRPPQARPAQRLWHGYAFILDGQNPHETIDTDVRWMFDAMRDLHQQLTGLQASYTVGHPGSVLRPQILHYPSGGGVRAREQHSGDPTVISQIVGLSEPGIDFDSGGNVFTSGARVVDTTGYHGLGDICLFRSDLWHEVTPVDPEAPLDFGSPRGRWTAVLPLVASPAVQAGSTMMDQDFGLSPSQTAVGARTPQNAIPGDFA
jgi:hypothetical protein